MADQETSIYNALEDMCEPFPGSAVRWRLGSKGEKDGRKWGLVFAYLEPRDIMDRLDEICINYSLHWSNDTEYIFDDKGHIIKAWIEIYDSKTGITIRRTDASKVVNPPPSEDLKSENDKIRKAAQFNRVKEIENTLKGQTTDAFKRACVLLGIGRYLYHLGQNYVDLRDRDKFDPPQLPKWALPPNERDAAPQGADKPQGGTNAPQGGTTQDRGGSATPAAGSGEATDKQKDFMDKLANMLSKHDPDHAERLRGFAQLETLTKKQAAEHIDEAVKAKDAFKGSQGGGAQSKQRASDSPEPPPQDDDDLPF